MKTKHIAEVQRMMEFAAYEHPLYKSAMGALEQGNPTPADVAIIATHMGLVNDMAKRISTLIMED